MGFLIGLLIALLKRDKEKNQKEIDQRERDRFAEEVNRLAQEIAEEEERLYISEILSGGKFAPFALYLRPFALEIMFRQREKQISLLHILLPHLLLTYLLVTEIVNFDLVLQTYCDPLGLTLISVGAPNALEGAGHVIVADFSWRERFRQLAERATTIIVIPGVQEGILSEIRWLRVTGLLVYAVFFKPAGYPKAEWKKMQEFYEEEEYIELPEYTSKQLSFRMYPSGRCYDVLTWRTVYWKRKKDLGNAQMRATLLNKPIPGENDQEDE